MLASIFQDSMLCTHKASEPKYLPPVMGGTGVTALFDNPENVFLYVLSYRGGAYRRIYATACSEMQDYLGLLERGIQSSPVLCPRLREKQEYFWGTYAEKVFIPKPGGVINTDEPPPALYEATGGQNRYQNYENRLIRTRHVVTRKEALVEWSHTRRLQSIFFSLFDKMETFARIDKDRSRTMRARYDHALSANTALQNLLKREAGVSDVIKLMTSGDFLTITVGKSDFTREMAEWVYLNGLTENYSLRDVSLSEDIFVRDEVSVEETFKVGGIPLRPFMSTGPTLRTTKTRVGLYQINSAMEEWSESLLSRLRTERDRLGRPLRPQEVGPICDIDPEWVNDDTGLIARCHRDTLGTLATYKVLLVSSDRRLANQMAETCNVTVIRLSPQEFVRQAFLSSTIVEVGMSLSFLDTKGIPTKYTYVDYGSLAAAAMPMQSEDGNLYRRRLLETGWSAEGRFSKVTLTEVIPRRLATEVHKPVTRPKTWRSGSRPSGSVYSTHLSWKRAVTSCTDVSWWRPGEGPPLTARGEKVSRRAASDLV
jgi:hypothetical protein